MPSLLMLALCALAISTSLVAKSDSSSQQQAANPSATPIQASEPSKPQGSQASGSGSAPAPGDSTKLEPIKIKKADYPAEARREGIQGKVWVKFFISEAGNVDSVEVISGDPILAKAAVDAAKKWKSSRLLKTESPRRLSPRFPLISVSVTTLGTQLHRRMPLRTMAGVQNGWSYRRESRKDCWSTKCNLSIQNLRGRIMFREPS